MPHTKFPNAKVRLTGSDGNAFAVLGNGRAYIVHMPGPDGIALRAYLVEDDAIAYLASLGEAGDGFWIESCDLFVRVSA